VDLGRLTLGEAIAVVSGLALLVFMFLPWYGEEARVEIPGVQSFDADTGTRTAWQAFTLIDVLLFATAVVAVALPLAVVARVRSIDLPERPAPVIVAIGLFAALLIFYRLLDVPDTEIDVSVGEVSIGRRIGIFLGLIAAAGIAAGGYLTSMERGQSPRRRPIAPRQPR
jgi:hypothetical protein